MWQAVTIKSQPETAAATTMTTMAAMVVAFNCTRFWQILFNFLCRNHKINIERKFVWLAAPAAAAAAAAAKKELNPGRERERKEKEHNGCIFVCNIFMHSHCGVERFSLYKIKMRLRWAWCLCFRQRHA